MQILRGFTHFSRFSRPTAVAIGNFDGLHLGHKAILHALVERAHAGGLCSLVLTFSPHPEKVLGQRRVAMIQTLPQRLAGLRKSGVQAVLVVPFGQAFSRLTSQEFLKDILISLLGAKEIIVGENFRFGLNRQGDIEELRRLGRKHGVIVHSVPQVKSKGRAVSSSLIRSFLFEGKVQEANALLGYPYEIEGKVIKGSSRGASLGFPTANILTANEITPEGVFITAATLSRQTYPSVTNIGFRPTFGRDRFQVETFIFGFNRSIYGKRIRLGFLKKIRDEKVFSSQNALVRQVSKDMKVAQDFFKKSKG
ncbi:MAG: bifunctional riboflavin kinase/FAD synthetase [Clostridiales bacterium]|nr:bifunctional riboflavin kinase/FAD synthetase [Clostridiales bacterium]